jgi:hypothetical protein
MKWNRTDTVTITMNSHKRANTVLMGNVGNEQAFKRDVVGSRECECSINFSLLKGGLFDSGEMGGA